MSGFGECATASADKWGFLDLLRNLTLLAAAAGALCGCTQRSEDSQLLLSLLRPAARAAAAHHDVLRVEDVFGPNLSAVCVFIDEPLIEDELRRHSDADVGVERILPQIRNDDFEPSDETVIYLVDSGGHVRKRYTFGDYGALWPLAGRTEQACVSPQTVLDFRDNSVPGGKATLGFVRAGTDPQ